MTEEQQENESLVSDQEPTGERRKLLLGVGITGAVAVWYKPVIDAIVLPAHADMSPDPDPEPEPTPEELCPMVVIGNVVTGPVSGTNTPPVCAAAFDVLSGSSETTLTITAITTSTLPANTSILIDGLGEASDIVGPRISWQGPATDAPFCSPVMPLDDVIFTITATCDAVTDGGTFSQDFNLLDII